MGLKGAKVGIIGGKGRMGSWFAELLESQGVEILIKWKTPNYRQENLEELHRFNLPKTDQISHEVLSLPIYPELEDTQVEYVAQTVKSFFS